MAQLISFESIIGMWKINLLLNLGFLSRAQGLLYWRKPASFLSHPSHSSICTILVNEFNKHTNIQHITTIKILFVWWIIIIMRINKHLEITIEVKMDITNVNSFHILNIQTIITSTCTTPLWLYRHINICKD